MSMHGRVVAITGGTGGMGLATGRRLAAAGAHVALLDVDETLVTASTQELSAGGSEVIGIAVDTADEAAMTSAVKEIVTRFGALDGLVTAAGVRQKYALALDVDLDVWEQTMRVNVTGTFVASRVGARAMQDNGGGAIVTVASVTSVSARMGQSAYCTSKAAVLHLTRNLALDLAGAGIRVNAVCPGVTATPMIEKAVRDEGPQVLRDKIEGSLRAFRPGIPLGRLSDPDEQAAAISFLLSPEASYITGAALFVDGGVSML